jgi:hypothetical protein
MALTGRFNLRKSFTGRLVLQVEEEVKTLLGLFTRGPARKRRWRDATILDMAAVELRPLIDLRYRPGSPLHVYSRLTLPSSAAPSEVDPIPASDRACESR